MYELPGYKIIEKIHEDSRTVIYRALKEKGISKSLPVIIKTQKKDAFDAKETVKLQNDYEITKSLEIEGVVKPYELVTHRNIPALIMEDFNSTPLTNLLRSKKMDLMQFLQIAIRVSEILGAIHEKGIIHRGIKPQIVLINTDTQQVKLTGFGDSSFLPPGSDIPLTSMGMIEGTLAYMSPEQTGRMDRGIDLRSDLYSLGIVFYEMLTGTPPFRSEEPLVLLHYHIAINPVPPHEVDKRIPEALSGILLKLLSKAPENRYQSTYGLLVDLKRCLSALKTSGKISSFEPGQDDRSPIFEVSRKIYGREAEIFALKEAYSSACRGERVFVLITGRSGIGKTSLERYFRMSSVHQKQGYITGKCERLQRGIPYGGFIHAFKELIDQILTESEETVEAWKKKMLKVLGPNGQIIIDVIPQVELIVGPQKPVPSLPAKESQNRFVHVFQNFVKAFCEKEHPLIIFLDDLQWVDSASLHLIRILATSTDLKYLLLLGAYREEEVDSFHPLKCLLDDLKKLQIPLITIRLQPLLRDQVETIVADTLGCKQENSLALAQVTYEKTGGNPFFINQFLKTLYQKKYIYFDFLAGCWTWDLDTILKADIADNLIRFVTQKIRRLTGPGQRTLKHAACIGTCFTLGMLAELNKTPLFDTLMQLRESIVEGLVLPYGVNSTRISSDEESRSEMVNLTYTFLHDRVQQAAYSLLSSKQKQRLHLRIGNIMLKRMEKAQVDEKICEIMDHLNRGCALIKDRHEKYKFAELNLAAGKKAKTSVAYRSAQQYIRAGLGILPEDCWQNRYELTLSLHTEGAETAYLNGDFAHAEEYNRSVLENAHTLLDQVKAYEIIIQAYVAQTKYREAVDVASRVLNQLGVFLPRNPGRLRILLGLLRTKMALHGVSLDYLNSLPQMTDEYKLAAMRILMSVFNPFYKTIREMFPSIAYRMIILSFKYGNSCISPFSYLLYGLLLVLIGEIVPGYQFASFALNLFKRYYTQELASKMYNVYFALISKWKSHMREALDPLLEAYQKGLETGDLEWAAHAIRSYCIQLFFTGSNMEKVKLETEKYGESMKKIKQDSTLHNLMLIRQSALNLSGDAETRLRMYGESFNEEEMLPVLIDAHDTDTIAGIRFHKCMLFYLFAEYAKALEMFREIEKQHETKGQFGFVLEARFFYSLVLLAAYPSLKRADQKRALQTVTSYQKMIRKGAEYAPMNYLHKWYLVEAERERVLGKELKAMELYDQAIAGARKNEYLQDEAVANELAAKYYLQGEKKKIAGTYMKEAHECYRRWGAYAKARDLEEKYGELIFPISEEKTIGDKAQTFAIDETGIRPQELDLATVLKSSHVISGEIVLSSLLKKIMKIVIEVSGAGRGLLILEKDGEFFIEAEGNAAQGTISLLEDEEISESTKLSHSVINYVIRTKQNVVLKDACEDDRFHNDHYMLQRRPRSLLCAPILHQGLIKGFIYLENNLTGGAFTDDRVEILRLIASQAAISLENARLYSSLLDDIERRKAVEEELRRSEQLARSLLDALKDSLVLIDPEGRVLSLNRTTARNLGMGVEKIVGRHLWDLYPSEIAKKRRELIERAVSTMKAIRVVDEQEGKISDNVIYPVIDSEGRVTRIAILERDITEQKKVEEQAKIQQLQLVRSDRLAMMGELAAGVAHEINNPNHSILLNTAILMKSYPDILSVLDDYHGENEGLRIGGLKYTDFKKTLEDSVRQIDECARRIGLIVKELKSFARPEPEDRKEEVDINIAVQSAILLGTPFIKKSTDNFTLQLEQNIPKVRGNLLKIEQVLLNLLQNACQSLPDRSRGVSIGTSHDKMHHRVVVKVEDEGEGMTEDVLSKIKEPFFTTRMESGGTGLGLSISSRIVKEHGGNLSVRSESGKGTVVMVSFPEGESK
jgi:PAS domain S-box-containing protein